LIGEEEATITLGAEFTRSRMLGKSKLMIHALDQKPSFKKLYHAFRTFSVNHSNNKK